MSVDNVSLLDRYLFEGCLFGFEDYFTFAADEVKRIVVNPTLFDKRYLYVVEPSFDATSGPVLIEFFAGTQSSENGTLLEPSNRNSLSSNLPVITLRLNPTIQNEGLRFAGRVLTATGLNPSVSTGAKSVSPIGFILNKSYKYMLKITNLNGAGVYLQTDFTWLEI